MAPLCKGKWTQVLDSPGSGLFLEAGLVVFATTKAERLLILAEITIRFNFQAETISYKAYHWVMSAHHWVMFCVKVAKPSVCFSGVSLSHALFSPAEQHYYHINYRGPA